MTKVWFSQTCGTMAQSLPRLSTGAVVCRFMPPIEVIESVVVWRLNPPGKATRLPAFIIPVMKRQPGLIIQKSWGFLQASQQWPIQWPYQQPYKPPVARVPCRTGSDCCRRNISSFSSLGWQVAEVAERVAVWIPHEDNLKLKSYSIHWPDEVAD